MAGQQDTGSGSLLAWLGDDNRLVDANEANQKFHYEIPLLQGCETVELAFKGRRDMLLFTSKRIVVVDIQGFLGMGKKVEYLSVPWYVCRPVFWNHSTGDAYSSQIGHSQENLYCICSPICGLLDRQGQRNVLVDGLRRCV